MLILTTGDVMVTEFKVEAGKIIISAQDGIDKDKDQVHSVSAKLSVEVDLAEAINEAFKVDPQSIIDIIKKLGL